jgi:tyrosinase
MQRSYDEQKRNLQDKVDVAFRQPAMNDFAVVLEEAHGWIHGVIGGGYTSVSAPGHMWPLEYSAYEPMFMLHHT